MNIESYFGKRFGERLVLSQFKIGYGKNKFLLCRCDKGHEAWVKLAHLRAGSGNRCKRCHTRRIAVKHGYSNSIVYKSWLNMRNRVAHDPSYLKRKINCCKQWELFENFLNDMGEPPDPRMQLDRIDGTKGYYPENCRWATRLQNNLNRTNLRIISYGGLSMCISHWEKYLNLPTDKLRKKLRFNRPISVIMEECGFKINS